MKINQIFAQAFSLAVLVSMTACGSPLVKGWRGDNPPLKPNGDDPGLSLTDPADCKKAGGHVWIDNQCVAYDHLTAAQCSKVPDYKWQDGKCVEATPADKGKCNADQQLIGGVCVNLPQLRAQSADALKPQQVVVGGTMKEVDFTVTPPDAKLVLGTQSCPDFFKLDAAGKLTSAAVDAKMSKCTVDMTAVKDNLVSHPVTVEVDTMPGFQGLCETYSADSAQRQAHEGAWATIVVIKEAVKKGTCADAATALAGAEDLDLSNGSITDLTPLSGLTKLRWLHLEGDQITDLTPVASLATLELIALYNQDGITSTNKITDPVNRNDPTKCPKNAASPAVADFCTLAPAK